MSDIETYLSPISSDTPNTKMLLSAFDLFDRSMTIFDKDGVLLGLNKHAMTTYGIKDKDAFINAKPNFFNSFYFNSSFDPHKLSTRDVIVKVFFDYDKFNEAFPGIGFKKGRALHYLRIHPIFNNKGTIEYIIALSTDLSTLKKDCASRDKFREVLPTMMNALGISTWTYDIESGRRILNEGPHLFPECETIDDFYDIVHKVDARVIKNLIHLIQFGYKMEGNSVIRVMDDNCEGGQIFLDVFCMPQLENEEVKGIFFFTKDVTQRENSQRLLLAKDKKIKLDQDKLHSSNLLLHSIIDRIPCLFYAKDAGKDFQYVMANSIYCDLMGKDISQIIGHMDSEVLPDGYDQEEIRKGDITALLKGSYVYRHESSYHGKTTIWSSLKYCIDTPDGKKLVICLAVNISDLIAANNRTKEAEIEAKRADKMKDAFLQNIATDLITPLNSVIGYTQLLLEPSTDEERMQYQKEITQSSKLLKAIIDEISALSKIQSGIATSNKETFDLCEYLAMNKPKYDSLIQHNVEFRLKMPFERCIVSIDKYYLSKIINRGLLNSIGYTFVGYIELGFECLEGGVQIYIEDTGVGLSQTEITAVKDLYENINAFSESIAFSLSLCNIFAKMLNGTIDFSSSKGEGSKVWIFIPTSISTT